MTVTMVMPAGWRRIEGGANAEASIAAAVDEALAGADRDSAAVSKHWMRERLRAALASPDGADARVTSVFYPTRAVAGTPLPVTGTMLELDIRSTGTDDAMRSLAALAARDATAAPLATSAGVVLRTHGVRDVTEALRTEVEGAPLEHSEREMISDAVDTTRVLRAQYVVPADDGSAWHAIAFSALLNSVEEGLEDVFLELFDAFASTLERGVTAP